MGKRVSRPKVRKYLNADALVLAIRQEFERIPDHRTSMAWISLTDVLMAAFAMFFLKDSSALAFDGRRKDGGHNLKPIFGIKNTVSDSRMREVLDPLVPDFVRPAYKAVFGHLQRGKALEPMVFMNGCYLMGMDGSGYFSSKKLHSPSCLEKKNSETGEITYQLQMLGAAIIHPDHKEVIPFLPEFIMKGDGQTKNDCERNAAKRFLEKLKQDHPRLGLIITEDALSSNAPHVHEIQRLGYHFILAVKPGDHDFLFKAHDQAVKKGKTIEVITEDEAGVIHYLRFVNGLPLNASNSDLLVNFLEYFESTDNKILYHNSWITDFTINRENAFQIMRGGRARWKMENENFNTLKNQGYNLEHNYGLGDQFLSMIFASLIVLAFFIDQVQQLCCSFFRSVWKRLGSKKALWDRMRAMFVDFSLQSIHMIYLALLHGYRKQTPQILIDDTS